MKEVKIHTLEQLISEMSLYDSINVGDEDNQYILEEIFFSHNLTADLFCSQCLKDRIFRIGNNDFTSSIPSSIGITVPDSVSQRLFRMNSPYPLLMTLVCSKDSDHKMCVSFVYSHGNLIKHGQFPSLASIENHGISKYRKLLADDYSDLNRAIGLNSHGIGAGAYVYLRRIFENLVEGKRQEAKNSDPNWDDDLYMKCRMAEKIEMLKDKLPALFKQSPHIYGILSKGVHELTEEECLKYFSVLLTAIKIILDEKLAEVGKREQEQALLKELATIASEI